MPLCDNQPSARGATYVTRVCRLSYKMFILQQLYEILVGLQNYLLILKSSCVIHGNMTVHIVFEITWWLTGTTGPCLTM